MDTATLIWIIVGILVIAIIVVVTLLLTRRGQAEKRRQAEHEKAEKLRAEAREREMAARENEARAVQAKADAASAAAAAQQAQARAAQADVEARRLADTVGEHEAEAQKHREHQEQTLRKADEVDPFVTGAARDNRQSVSNDDVRRDEARDSRAMADDGIPAAPDGVTGRDTDTRRDDAAYRDDVAYRQDAGATTDAPITRPPADTDRTDGVVQDDTVPPPTRRDRA